VKNNRNAETNTIITVVNLALVILYFIMYLHIEFITAIYKGIIEMVGRISCLILSVDKTSNDKSY